MCSFTSQCGICTIEIRSPSAFHDRYIIQTEDVDIEFSKVFTQYIKRMQHQNSQRANSIFTNDVFSLIYSYLSRLELNEPQGDSFTQTSRHTIVRQKIHIFSKFLAWFIIYYFNHNIYLIKQARKNIRPQKTDDKTVLAEQSDSVWDKLI